LICGEKETGITTFLIDKNVDTGNMLLAEAITIGPDETAGELHDRLMVLGAKLASQTLVGLADGALSPIPQTSEGVTAAPKLFPEDCVIDFRKPVRRLHDFIRGLSPYPGAVVILHGIRIKILRSRIPNDGPNSLLPGQFQVTADHRLLCGALDGAIEVLELQREGKRAMTAEAFLRGDRDLFRPPL